MGPHHVYPSLCTMFAVLQSSPVEADRIFTVQYQQNVLKVEKGHSDLVVNDLKPIGAVTPVSGERKILDEPKSLFVAFTEVAKEESVVEFGVWNRGGVEELHVPELADESEATAPGESTGVQRCVRDGQLDNFVAQSGGSVYRGLDESGACSLA